jgi:hypothetical protein
VGFGEGVLDVWHQHRLRREIRVVLEKSKTFPQRSHVENWPPSTRRTMRYDLSLRKTFREKFNTFNGTLLREKTIHLRGEINTIQSFHVITKQL